MSRLVVDPVTRVGGHLRVEVDSIDGAVGDAWVSATMYRGLESVLRGRPARDAWLLAQRICGSCPSVHGLASVRAVESALGVTIPKNARLLRNLILGSTFLQHDVAAFYVHQLPDWADASSALIADPSAASTLARSLSDWPNADAAYFSSARDRLGALVAGGPLANGPWGHPAYRLPPELNLVLYAHYLDALDWLRRVVSLRTILTGKSPHPQTFIVGGMASAPAWGGPVKPGDGEHPWGAARHSPAPLSANGLADVADFATLAAPFVDQVFAPDVAALAAYYPDWEGIGAGIGHYLSFGEFPRDDTGQAAALYFARGRVMDRDTTHLGGVDQSGVGEAVSHSWYRYDGSDDALLHPLTGQTTPAYAGPKPPFDSLTGFERYSWSKAPRFEDDPMEVGPLARMMVAFAGGSTDVRVGVDDVTRRLNTGMAGMFSTLGRIAAQSVEAQIVVARLHDWLRELVANLSSGDLAVLDLNAWDTANWPAETAGAGLVEGPGGATGHWLSVRDARVAGYQVVAGGTWNASPRDGRDRRGALEQALVGTPIADPARPLEVLRTVHSFDPCLACAVH